MKKEDWIYFGYCILALLILPWVIGFWFKYFILTMNFTTKGI